MKDQRKDLERHEKKRKNTFPEGSSSMKVFFIHSQSHALSPNLTAIRFLVCLISFKITVMELFLTRIYLHMLSYFHRAGNLRNDFRQIRKILQRNFSLSYLLLSCLKTNRHGMTSPPKLYQTNSELLYTVVTYFSLLICMGGG